MTGILNTDQINNAAGSGPPTFSNGANIVGGALSGTFTGSPTFSGTPVFSGGASFSGILSLVGGTISAVNVNAVDANKTLVRGTDSNQQVFTGFTTSRTVTLPTTGVIAGETWLLNNNTLFDMVVNASNGSALTVANSVNIDATVRSGFVLLVALVATPTTPANWLVLDIRDTVILDSASGQWATGTNLRFFRDGRMITFTSNGGSANAGVPFTSALGTAATATGYVPLRFRTNSTVSGNNGGLRFSLINGGSGLAAVGDVDLFLNSNGQVTWTYGGSRTNSQQDFSVSYLIVA